MSARACILGCAGPGLTDDERAFFADAAPWGFILFARNIASPDQLRALTGELRAAVGREALIFIDQEGGRVQRLRPPHWPDRPPAGALGALHRRDAVAGLEACRLHHRLIAADLRAVGVTADCAPMVDVRRPGADPIVGDRAFSDAPEAVSALGRAALDGLTAGGVAGVVKHMPGHGRADADSHLALPHVDADAADLDAVDLAPFRTLRDAPMGMTAHVRYAAWDDRRPATTSPRVICDVIRGAIGFDGLLMTDDLSMKALDGS
ncbi:MAG: beta-N-acetylhexosaminidase, partial [Caulobacterales bacterium]|nr:beta-N-acetylhexosaminidase [Caulobacterales bacterium]